MGKIRTREHCERISQAKIGSNRGAQNPNWNNGATVKNLLERLRPEYTTWRRKALRDKGDICGKCGESLLEKCPCCGHKPDRHVHHIKDFANNHHERYSVKNALVLCESCHRSHHKK